MLATTLLEHFRHVNESDAQQFRDGYVLGVQARKLKLTSKIDSPLALHAGFLFGNVGDYSIEHALQKWAANGKPY